MAIETYNKIDVKNDDFTVIKAKIEKLKELLDEGKVTQEEYDAERDRVESELKELNDKPKLGYAFNW